ncbi:uncharacterized protein LOC117791340 [Drosophila innubila]|uniref:uncharacterized protein LOC117791340 n=1 Tax=Drosophila innubila TaxID=198719 RepID=UPI00148CAD99|nr:uncharacterized protein LOC117791340 [Drosophila innubila]
MCMPYLGKLFSGGQRRRNNATETPRPSLAPTPQQSNATIQTTNTGNMTVGQKNSLSPVDVGYSGLLSDVPGSVPNGSIGSEPAPIEVATPTTSLAGAGTDVPRPTSWWEFFGIHRAKKANVGSPSASS